MEDAEIWNIMYCIMNDMKHEMNFKIQSCSSNTRCLFTSYSPTEETKEIEKNKPPWESYFSVIQSDSAEQHSLTAPIRC